MNDQISNQVITSGVTPFSPPPPPPPTTSPNLSAIINLPPPLLYSIRGLDWKGLQPPLLVSGKCAACLTALEKEGTISTIAYSLTDPSASTSFQLKLTAHLRTFGLNSYSTSEDALTSSDALKAITSAHSVTETDVNALTSATSVDTLTTATSVDALSSATSVDTLTTATSVDALSSATSVDALTSASAMNAPSGQTSSTAARPPPPDQTSSTAAHPPPPPERPFCLSILDKTGSESSSSQSLSVTILSSSVEIARTQLTNALKLASSLSFTSTSTTTSSSTLAEHLRGALPGLFLVLSSFWQAPRRIKTLTETEREAYSAQVEKEGGPNSLGGMLAVSALLLENLQFLQPFLATELHRILLAAEPMTSLNKNGDVVKAILSRDKRKLLIQIRIAMEDIKFRASSLLPVHADAKRIVDEAFKLANLDSLSPPSIGLTTARTARILIAGAVDLPQEESILEAIVRHTEALDDSASLPAILSKDELKMIIKGSGDATSTKSYHNDVYNDSDEEKAGKSNATNFTSSLSRGSGNKASNPFLTNLGYSSADCSRDGGLTINNSHSFNNNTMTQDFDISSPPPITSPPPHSLPLLDVSQHSLDYNEKIIRIVLARPDLQAVGAAFDLLALAIESALHVCRCSKGLPPIEALQILDLVLLGGPYSLYFSLSGVRSMQCATNITNGVESHRSLPFVALFPRDKGIGETAFVGLNDDLSAFVYSMRSCTDSAFGSEGVLEVDHGFGSVSSLETYNPIPVPFFPFEEPLQVSQALDSDSLRNSQSYSGDKYSDLKKNDERKVWSSHSQDISRALVQTSAGRIDDPLANIDSVFFGALIYSARRLIATSTLVPLLSKTALHVLDKTSVASDAVTYGPAFLMLLRTCLTLIYGGSQKPPIESLKSASQFYSIFPQLSPATQKSKSPSASLLSAYTKLSESVLLASQEPSSRDLVQRLMKNLKLGHSGGYGYGASANVSFERGMLLEEMQSVGPLTRAFFTVSIGFGQQQGNVNAQSLAGLFDSQRLLKIFHGMFLIPCRPKDEMKRDDVTATVLKLISARLAFATKCIQSHTHDCPKFAEYAMKAALKQIASIARNVPTKAILLQVKKSNNITPSDDFTSSSLSIFSNASAERSNAAAAAVSEPSLLTSIASPSLQPIDICAVFYDSNSVAARFSSKFLLTAAFALGESAMSMLASFTVDLINQLQPEIVLPFLPGLSTFISSALMAVFPIDDPEVIVLSSSSEASVDQRRIVTVHRILEFISSILSCSCSTSLSSSSMSSSLSTSMSSDWIQLLLTPPEQKTLTSKIDRSRSGVLLIEEGCIAELICSASSRELIRALNKVVQIPRQEAVQPAEASLKKKKNKKVVAPILYCSECGEEKKRLSTPCLCCGSVEKDIEVIPFVVLDASMKRLLNDISVGVHKMKTVIESAIDKWAKEDEKNRIISTTDGFSLKAKEAPVPPFRSSLIASDAAFPIVASNKNAIGDDIIPPLRNVESSAPIDPVLLVSPGELFGRSLNTSLFAKRRLGSSSVCDAYQATQDAQDDYTRGLRKRVFGVVTGLKQTNEIVKNGYPHGGGGGGITTIDPRHARQMANELRTFSTDKSLLHYGSSIFVRVDESDQSILRACITGADSTPYANGVLTFDIRVPPAYPQCPPEIICTSHSSGTVRFNPNLYSNGKICLSILGTWQGPSWDSSSSTLFGALIAIQALVMVQNPIENEPGFEDISKTVTGKLTSAAYNAEVRLATLRHAMENVLKRPPLGFSSAVRAHFYYKRNEVRAQAIKWSEESILLARFQLESLRLSSLRPEAVLKRVQAIIRRLQSRAKKCAGLPFAMSNSFRVFETVSKNEKVSLAAKLNVSFDDHPGDLVFPILPPPPAGMFRSQGLTHEDDDNYGMDERYADAAYDFEDNHVSKKQRGKIAIKEKKKTSVLSAPVLSTKETNGGVKSSSSSSSSPATVASASSKTSSVNVISPEEAIKFENGKIYKGPRSISDLAELLAKLRRRASSSSSLLLQNEITVVQSASPVTSTSVLPAPLHDFENDPSLLIQSSERLQQALTAVSASIHHTSEIGTSIFNLESAIASLVCAIEAADSLSRLTEAKCNNNIGEGALATNAVNAVDDDDNDDDDDDDDEPSPPILASDFDLLCANSSLVAPFWTAIGTLRNSFALFDELDKLSPPSSDEDDDDDDDDNKDHVNEVKKDETLG